MVPREESWGYGEVIVESRVSVLSYVCLQVLGWEPHQHEEFLENRHGNIQGHHLKGKGLGKVCLQGTVV